MVLLIMLYLLATWGRQHAVKRGGGNLLALRNRMGHGRDRPRGSILALTLILTVVLFILGCAYLSFLERDNRFAGIQERSERAWDLAQSGLEYYRVYGGTMEPLQPGKKALNPPRVLAKVYVPASSKSQYFELADLGQGNMMCQGVVVNSIASPKHKHEVRRVIVIPHAKLEDAYELSHSFEPQ